jgi:hypothetical protein
MKKFLNLLCLAASFLSSSGALAISHYCEIGVPAHAIPSYSYQTAYHHTEWDSFDYAYVQNAFGSPPVTPYIYATEEINGDAYVPHLMPMTHFGSLPEEVDWYVQYAQNGSYTIEGTLDYGSYVGGGGFLSAYAMLSDCSDSGTVNNTPAVALSGVGTVTLNDNINAHITYVPAFLDATDSKIEIKRVGGSTWYTLHSNNPYYNSYAKVAGTFKVRGVVTYQGVDYYSPEYNYTVNFPTYGNIVGSSIVSTAINAAWSDIKNYASSSSSDRVEKAFWISFNTQTRQYVVGPVLTTNPPASNGTASVAPTTASVTVGTRPADSPASPVPTDSPTYYLAIFHGHSPFINVHSNHCRPTGPSSADLNHANSNDVVGILYDYNASFHCGGDSVNLSADEDQYGPQKRSTP